MGGGLCEGVRAWRGCARVVVGQVLLLGVQSVATVPAEPVQVLSDSRAAGGLLCEFANDCSWLTVNLETSFLAVLARMNRLCPGSACAALAGDSTSFMACLSAASSTGRIRVGAGSSECRLSNPV